MQALGGSLNPITQFSQGVYRLHPNESIKTFDAETATQQELVEYFILHPDRLENELPSVLVRADCLDSIVIILKEVFKRSDSLSREFIVEYLSEGILSLPFELQDSIFDKDFLFFTDVVEILSLEDRKKILQAMTRGIRNWKDLFLKVFERLKWKDELKPCEDKPASYFLSSLMEAFSPRRKKQWIRYCCKVMDYDTWAFFLFTLKRPDRALALRISITDLNFDLSEEGYFSCIESLSNQDHQSLEIKNILEQLLKKFYQAKQFQRIVNDFTALSDNAQISLLNAMTFSKQVLIFSKYRNELSQMALWYHQLICLQPDLKSCRKLTINIFSTLGEGNLVPFLEILNIREFKGAAYLLAYLPIEVLQEFVFSVPFQLRGELLVKSASDANSSNILKTIKKDVERNSLIYQVMTFKMEDLDSLSTLEEFSNSLENIDKDVVPDYADTVVLIPPVLIGLLAAIKKERASLLVVAPYMTEEQLNFFASHFDSSQFYDFTLKCGTSLTNNRFLALLDGLSPDKLLNYVKFKTEELEKVSIKFKDRYQSLLLNFDSLKTRPLMTHICFEEFQKDVFELQSMTKLGASAHYHYLWHFLQVEKDDKIFSKTKKMDFQDAVSGLKKSMDSLTGKRPLFEGCHAPINLMLAELQDLIIDFDQEPEVDLTSVLYEGFWSFVREGNLPHLGISPHSQLGITSASQLTCLGIRSNEDLKYLGISVELGKKVETLIRNIEESLRVDIADSSRDENSHVTKKQPSRIWTLWEECISLDLSDAIVKSKCSEIVNILILPQIKHPQFETIYRDLCEEILKFSHLFIDDKALIERKRDVLAAQQEIKSLEKRKNRKIGPSQSDILLEALIILRKQHPLFCLQRYLTINANLKKTWKIFHSRGVLSIHQLFAEKIIASPVDLLRLADFLDERVVL